MAQLIFAQAKSIYRAAYKQSQIIDDAELSETLYNGVIKAKRHEFKKILEIAQLLHDDYEEVCNKKVRNWYFVTIRPDETKCTFEDFYKLVKKYINRRFMKDFTLSFEQKGITDDDMGKGFHCHIVCNTTHRSKGECLRDTISTFSGIAAQNCIDIKTTRNPDHIIEGYLTNYESDDNHKIVTKDTDYKWRLKYSLKSLYTSGDDFEDDIFSIKSGTEKISISFE